MNLKLTTFSGLIEQSKEFKTDIDTAFSLLCSEEQTARLRKLMQRTKEEQFFSVGGEFYKGNRRMAIIKYILAEPELADFEVWIQNNCERYTPAQ